MKKKIKNISLAIGFAMIAFIALMFVNHKLNNINEADIVVAKKNIAKNTEITESNVNTLFEVVTTNDILKTEEHYDDVNSLIGKYISEEIYLKETINKNKISDKKNILATYKDPVRVSFAVAAISDAVNGKIRSGDYVNIYSISTQEVQSDEKVLKDVYVETVTDSSGTVITTEDKTTCAVNFTVILENGAEKDFYSTLSNHKIVVTKCDK